MLHPTYWKWSPGRRGILDPRTRTLRRQFDSLPFDDRAAEEYGKLRANLAVQGSLIGPNDLMIAATSLANGLVLVTHNTAEFRRVPGLTLEDWQ